MPLDVIMPALGMAQDTGVILTWHKSPGEPVAEGDALFEVETDKAAMEVEAQGSGYLTDVTATAGDEVPVGQVLARISESPEGEGSRPDTSGDQPGKSAEKDDQADSAIPDGDDVIMPALGMTQDVGLIVAWRKSPGDPVSATDILFEVETDKSVVEVEAGHDGFVAALLAEQGEEAPVGDVIAIISREKPEAPISRSQKASITSKAPNTASPAPSTATEPEQKQKSAPVPARQVTSGNPAQSVSGRLLASPKARRLALERGLDLSRLAEQGYPQPYHAKDLEVLENLAKTTVPQVSAIPASRCISAEVSSDGFEAFASWAAKETGLADAGALLATFAGTSLGRNNTVVALEAFGETRTYKVHGRRAGSLTEADSDTTPDLRLRDLRFGHLSSIQVGPENTPVINILTAGTGLKLVLECSADQMDASSAIHFLADFAGRMEQPLRHLL